jgi:polyketide synthase 12
VSIAAINGPSAVVVSGEVAALDELVSCCTERELRARRIDVDYASHSVAVEAIREQLAEAISGIEPRSSRTTFFSTVTGDLIDTAELGADYWFRNIRQTVEFDQAVRTASRSGYRIFIESSSHPALINGVEDTVNQTTNGGADAIVVPTLGREDGGIRRFLASAAQAFVCGLAVDWRAALPEARFAELPTYAFERRRFWLSADGAAVDAAGLGLASGAHALLGAVVELPASGGVVLTGRLSSASQSWLADHAVGGVAVFPGAGFVELAIRAGDEVGCTVIDELTLRTPLVVPTGAAGWSAAVQVVVDPPEESGRRSISVFSRVDADAEWVLHAEGQLSSATAEPAADLSTWPPVDAEPVDITGLYDRLATGGYGYGPAFQGLTAMWRRGDELFAEVTVPQTAGGTNGFGVHPAMLDASLHVLLAAHNGAEIALPFLWQGVSLHAAGASSVRARIVPVGSSAVSVELADGLGLPVLSVASMVARPVSQQQLMAAVSGASAGQLFEVIWSPTETAAVTGAKAVSYEVFKSVVNEQDPLTETYQRAHQALAVVQSRLIDQDARVLVVSTRGAMALPGEDVTDLAGAAVWGLVRSVQTEHPGRIVLVDSDVPLNDAAVTQALAAGEPQVLLRDGTVHTARVHGSRAVDSLLVSAGDGPWRLGLSSAGTFENLQLACSQR